MNTLLEYTDWSTLLPSIYRLTDEGIYIGQYSSSSYVDLLHLVFAPAISNPQTIHVTQDGSDANTCGWIDLPCKTVHYAYSHLGEQSDTIHLTASQSQHSPEITGTSFEVPLDIKGESGVNKHVKTVGTSYIFQLKASVFFSSLTFVLSSENSLNCPFISAISLHTTPQSMIHSGSKRRSLHGRHSLLASSTSFSHPVKEVPKVLCSQVVLKKEWIMV